MTGCISTEPRKWDISKNGLSSKITIDNDKFIHNSIVWTTSCLQKIKHFMSWLLAVPTAFYLVIFLLSALNLFQYLKYCLNSKFVCILNFRRTKYIINYLQHKIKWFILCNEVITVWHTFLNSVCTLIISSVI